MSMPSFCRSTALVLSCSLGYPALAAVVQLSARETGEDDSNRIRQAMTSAGTGGTVELGEGTFWIEDTAGVEVTGLTLKGQGWEKTVIKSARETCQRAIKLKSGARLEGVTVTGFTGEYRGVAVYAENGYVSWCCLSNNTMAVSGSSNGAGAGLCLLQGGVDHSIIANNTMRGGTYYGAGVGGWTLKGNVTVDTCLIYGNANESGKGGGISFYTLGGKQIKIVNCTIANNTDSSGSGGVFISNGSATLDMKNCIITGNTTTSGSDGNQVIGDTVTDTVSSCYYQDPSFVNAANGDYRLAQGTPVFQQGETYTGIGVDLSGNAFGTVPSIGCYELDCTVARPTFSQTDGRTFVTSLSVSLTCETEGASIYYTTDGSTPTTASALYSGSPIVLTATTTLKIIAYKDGLDPSAVASATYTQAAAVAPELGELNLVTRPTAAVFQGTLDSLGNNGATLCDIYLAIGTTEGSLGTPVKIATATSAFKYILSGLTAETTYYYEITATNNADDPMSAIASGSFTTKSALDGLKPEATAYDTRMMLQDAIDASPNGVVALAAGTFEIDDTLVLNNGASLIGLGTVAREDVIIKQVTASKRVLKIENSEDTVISNLTVTAGSNTAGGIVMNSGLVENCVIRDIETKNLECGKDLTSVAEGSKAPAGAGVNMCGGVVRGCLITRCNAQDSGGGGCPGEAIYLLNGALVENCQVTHCGRDGDDNGTALWGGAICLRGNGTVRGCLVANNYNRVGGSGISIVGATAATSTGKCVVENCTVVGNRQSSTKNQAYGLNVASDFGASAAYNVILRNNIIWGNLAKDGSTVQNYNLDVMDWTTSTVEYNNMSPAINDGTANISVDPQFVDAANEDYHTARSYCTDAGSNQAWMTDAFDLDGHARILNETVDLGCYEYDDGGTLSCRMRLQSDGAQDAATVSLECDCSGATATAASWTFTRQQDGAVLTASGVTSSIVLPVGVWDAYVLAAAGEQTAEASTLGAVDVRASKVYVSKAGSKEYPYATAATATDEIDAAFPLLGVGGTLYVDEGTYVIAKPLTLDGVSGSRVESLAGPEKTIIRLDNVENFNTSGGFYGLNLNHGSAYVSGITLVGGRPSDDYTGAGYVTLGLAKVTAAGAMITNCVFRDNMASKEAAGFGNKGPGLQLTAGTVVDSTFTRINHYSAGNAATFNGVLYISGGLADRLRIVDCWDDSADNIAAGGGGDIVAVLSAGELRNSLVAGCSSVHSSMVYAGVSQGANPAVDHGGSVVNCTIVANTNLVTKADDYHHEAGIFVNGGTLVNSIVADNYSAYAEGILNLVDSQGVDTGITYTLVNGTSEEGFATEANHNVVVPAGTAIFHKPEQGDYTLLSGSAAVNAAQLLDWMATSRDLAGAPRIVSRIPDMGCYESRPRGLAIRLR